MGLTRRNALIGLGTIAVGGGVITGTGAFDAVEADRAFNVEVDGDAEALLEIVPGDTDLVQEDEDGVVYIDSDALGGGLNDQALTRFNAVLTLGNNGSNDIEVWIELPENVEGVAFLDSNGDEIMDDESAVSIDAGVTDAETLDLVFDTRDANNSLGGRFEAVQDEVITIHANSVEA